MPALILVLLFVASLLQAQPTVTDFHSGITSPPTSVTLGPDGATWFVEQNGSTIGRITPAGVASEYVLQPATGQLGNITVGPDGAMWFTETGTDKIGRMTTDGTVTNLFPLSPGAGPTRIVTGPDGALWFIESYPGKIARMTTAGAVQEFQVGGTLSDMTLGPDGALWFTKTSTSQIGRLSTAGALALYPTKQPGSSPLAITPGPDNALWFTEGVGKVARITVGPEFFAQTPIGTVTEYAVSSTPAGIVLGPDGALWFTEPGANQLGRITTAGVVAEYGAPSPGGPLAVGPDGALWFAEEGAAMGRAALPATSAFEFAKLYFGQDVTVIGSGPDGAMWFGSGSENLINRITPGGGLSNHSITSIGGLTTGPDGALWVTDVNRGFIDRITTSGTPAGGYGQLAGRGPADIVAGPDGALWFAELTHSSIGRVTTAGVVTEFPASGATKGVAMGPDGAVWFTENLDNNSNSWIGRITPAGALSEYHLGPQIGPAGICLGPDGALWFTEYIASRIGRITTAGTITEYTLPSAGSEPSYIVAGADGALWFTEYTRVGRITTSGTITEYSIPGVVHPNGIAAGPDGALWFADEIGAIGHISPPANTITGVTIFVTTNLPGLSFAVDGVTYNSPQAFTWSLGSRHSLSVLPPPLPIGTRLVFDGWSDGQPQSHMIIATATSLSVLVANAHLQFQLTALPSYPGNIVVSPPSADGFYDAGTIVQLTTTATPGFRFAGWQGSITSDAYPLLLTMDAPKSETALFNTTSCDVFPSGPTSVSTAGGNQNLKVTTGPFCTWATASPVPWITITPGVGTGPGTVTYTVAASPDGKARQAAISVGGQEVLITQGVSPVGFTGTPLPGGLGFGFRFSHPDGYQNFGVVNILIASSLDARNACYLAYDQSNHILYLVNDAGTALLDPGLSLSSAPPYAIQDQASAPIALQNSQCSVAASSLASGSGTELGLSLTLTFSPSFYGSKIVYMAARDQSGANSGWHPKGTWSVPGGPVDPLNVAVVTPVASTSNAQQFQFSFSDTKGAQDLSILNVLINSSLNGANACYLAYNTSRNLLYLVNDQNTALSPALVPGSPGLLSNSQCTVFSATSSITASGNVVLSLTILFSPSFAGDQIIYMAAQTTSQNSGWRAAGTVITP